MKHCFTPLRRLTRANWLAPLMYLLLVSLLLSGQVARAQYCPTCPEPGGGGSGSGGDPPPPTTPTQSYPPVLNTPANGSTVATTTPTYSGSMSYVFAGAITVRLYVDGSSTPFSTSATYGTSTFSLVQPTALSLGSHTVYATAQDNGLAESGPSATITFTVQIAPTITSFTPGTGPIGQSVTVSGTNLAGATAVSVNNTAGTITGTPTAGSLTFTVGAGSSTGVIRVTTPGGTAASGTSFTVVPLTITALAPTRNLRTAARNASVAVTFSQPLQNTAATGAAVRVFSQQRGGLMAGSARGAATVSGSTITFDPTTDFRPGETLLVTTTPAATASSGSTLGRGHVHQFTAATGGTGRGTFVGGSSPGVGSPPTGMPVGDVDGDGDLDFVTASLDNATVSVRLNGGDNTGSNTGTFTNGSNPTVGNNPGSVALADVDGDGDLDLLAANIALSGPGTVSVRLNGGDATGSNTGTFSGGSDPGVGNQPRSVAVGDVDGDGDLDLLTANYGSGTVSVRLNGGDATGSNTGTFSGGSDPGVGSQPLSVAVGDVDGDGDLDLLTANYGSGTVSVRLNGGDATGSNTGTFSGGSDPGVGTSPRSVAVGDVDGDGDLDLLTANYTGAGTVSVRLNGGDNTGSNTGGFAAGSEVSVGNQPRSVTLGDVDGDGDLDLLTANDINFSGTVSVRLNGGNASGSNTGTFAGGSEVGVGSNPDNVAVGDVDGDGDLDLLTANFGGGGTASVRFNQQPPTIASFAPTTGPIGQSVVVTGTDLTGASAATVNGVAGSITANTGTSLTFTVGAGSTTGVVRVITAAGTATSPGSFVVIPAPAISGFSPTSGPIGQTVTVSGTNFTGATALKVGGTGVTFTFVNSTTLTFMVAAGSPSGVLAVTTPGGTATSTGSFTFIPPPTVTSIAPSPAASGSTVTITGTNLSGATGVTVNGTVITGFTVGGGGTTITFTVPVGASSGTIGVTTPGGSTTSPGSLTVDNTPPTATLSTTAGGSTGISPIPFTVVFSEGVTGFGPAGLTITGGTLTGGSLGGSSTSYSFTVVPTGSGSVVTVQVAAGGARDAANNPNPASNTVSVTYSGPPPGADLINTGTLLTVQAGGVLYVGTGGLGNQGGTLTNSGTLHVAGPLNNPAALDLGVGSLEVKGDLTNAGTLTPGTSAVTFSGVADQTLTPGGATLYQLLVNKPTAGANTLRLTGDLTVSNTLTLTTGILSTGPGAKVVLGPTATLSETAPGYVTGTVETTRPVSTAGTAQAFGGLGLRLTPSGSTLPGSTRVTRTTGTALTGTGSSQSIKRYFDIVPAVNSGLNVALTLNYRDDELNNIAEGSLALFKSTTGAAGPWARQAGTTFDAAANTATKTGITSFSFWTLGSTANPLPVTLLDFAARAEGPAAVRLTWATAQEVDNAGFVVERSRDGHAFTAIDTVAGAGSSPVRHDYTLLDAQLPAGASLLYYRLRQTDLNGTVAYSPVRTVSFTQSFSHSFTVFPTRVAAGQDAQYRYTGPAGAGTLEILNVLGQVLGTVALDGRANGPVPLAGRAAGTYLLRYTGPAGRFTTRCVID
jgi:hypothetical protein